MNKAEREEYFLQQEDELLKGGAAFSEWCTFISKSVYDAFVNGADLATIITTVTCIETYLKTENLDSKKKNLSQLIDEEPFLSDEDKFQLHINTGTSFALSSWHFRHLQAALASRQRVWPFPVTTYL